MWSIPIDKLKPDLPPGTYWVMTGEPFTRAGVKHYPANYAHVRWNGSEWLGDQPHHIVLEAEQVRQFTTARV